MTRMCNRCGTRNTRQVEVDWHGITVAVGRLCSPCMEVSLGEAARLKEQFEELIALGVNRALANEVMIDRINARCRVPKEVNA